MPEFPPSGPVASRRSVLAGGGALLAAALGGAHAAAPAAAAPRINPIVALNASELSKQIRRRRLSCVEVMTAYLDHIETYNPQVNAIVNLRPRADLLAEAAAKDALLASGTYEGWMHGFPHAVKDLANVKGLPTTLGFFKPPFAAAPAAADAVFVERMRAAGAIFIGKTNTPEFGLGSHTYNNVFGTTLNPYDLTKSAGGSSGGATAALAMRMLPVADGSDFFGSLRNPAGWCNVLGMRPSFGRVPGNNADVFVQQGGLEGPMARTVRDLALLLETMSGYDPRAPLSIREERPFSAYLNPDVDGRKVAWLGDLGGYLPMEPGVLDLAATSLDVFDDLGMSVSTMSGLPTGPGFAGNADLWQLWLIYRHWLIGGILNPLYSNPTFRAAMKPEAIYEVDGLLTGADGNPAISGLTAYNGSVKRTAMYQAFRVLFETYDYVALPTAQVFPFDASLTWPNEINGTAMSSYHRWMEVTSIGTLINAPVINLPVGFGANGLPMGIQVIAKNHADLALLQLAKAYEEETRWVQKVRPALLG